MTYFNLTKRLAVVGLLFLCACKQSEEAGVPNEPYPDLEEQRSALAARDIVYANRVLDSTVLLQDLEFLASPACEGRRPGTAGHQKALDFILQRLRQLGVDSLGGSLIQSFTGRSLGGYTEGRNVLALVKGSKNPDKFIVLSAHYDHLGLSGSTYYAGADDNASGTASVLSLAAYLKAHQPEYSVILALLDREETGLEGAYAAVEHLKSTRGIGSIVFNLNLDMVARSDRNELFVCGVRYKPSLASVVKSVQPNTGVHLLMGHDGGGAGDDWSGQSDHAAFMKASVPFLYLGVEDHADYHKVTDRFEKVNPSRFVENAHAILLMLKEIDKTI